VTGDQMSLSCGVGLDELARQVFDGELASDREHQRRCPECAVALAHIRAVAEGLDRVATAPVAVPAGVLRRVMVRLRAAPALLTVTVGSQGTTEVAESVVARVAREAALAVEGVKFASALPSSRPAGHGPGLRVRLVVSYGPSLHSLAALVRDSVGRATADRTGVHIEHIDVSIDDLA